MIGEVPASGLPPKKAASVMVDRPGRAARQGRRGMIPADSAVDHRHLGSRETTRTLFILTMFILAFCACLVVTWFLKDWMVR